MKGCRPMTDVEISSVFNQLGNKRDKSLFLLGCKSGLRISELLSLKVGDVLEYGIVGNYVTVAKCNTKGKAESKTLPLSKSAKETLQDYLNDFGVLDHRAPLFKSFQSQEPITRQQAHRILKGAFKSLKMQGKLATHSLRKTFAHKVHIALGEKIERTKVALCHKSLSSTSHYIQVDREEVENAILGLG
ncbi:MAG TPA: tyrosine-type recombinase/integrase [Rhabdochlamydiaceae bacterium]